MFLNLFPNGFSLCCMDRFVNFSQKNHFLSLSPVTGTMRFLLPLFLFSVLSGYGQVVTVHVENVRPSVQRMYALTFADYISLAPVYLQETAPQNGSAELAFNLSKFSWVRLTGGGAQTDFIAVPGTTYHFSFAEDETGKPYFLRINESLPQSDPNRFTDSLNGLINAYITQYNTSLYMGSLAKKTALFCDSLSQAFSAFSEPIFETYLAFRLDELRLLSRVFSDQAFFAARVKNAPFTPENPDYAYAFTEIYKGRLRELLLRKKMEPVKALIHGFQRHDTIMQQLSADFYYPNNAVGEGAVIFGLSELWFDKTYNRDALLSLVSRFADSSSHASVRSLAARFYRKWREPLRGDQTPSLTVLDAAGKETEVPTQFKRPVYLCFFDPDSEVATAELAALNELKKKWKDRLIPIAVLINAGPEKLINIRNGLRLTYDIFENKEFSALGAFRLKNDCTCMVLSPDGTYLMPKAPLPSEPDAELKLASFTK